MTIKRRLSNLEKIEKQSPRAIEDMSDKELLKIICHPEPPRNISDEELHKIIENEETTI